MNITIDILYHGAEIDFRNAQVDFGHYATQHVPIDIGVLLDRHAKNTIQNLIGEPIRHPPLAHEAALTYHTFGAKHSRYRKGDLDVPNEDTDKQRRRRRNRRILNRIGDPENGFPILRQLIQTFAPMLIQYLMTNLPVWLADLDDEKENATPVV